MQGKGKASRIIALVLVGLMVVSALLSVFLSMAYAEERPATHISITAQVLPDAHTLRCEQTILYGNATGEELSQLFFAVYPNAFRRSATLPVEESQAEAAFPAGYGPGGVVFSSVQVDGEAARYGFAGQDEAFLRVDAALLPGETARVELRYDIVLCENGLFAGWDREAWRLLHAFVTPCAFRDGSFVCNPALSVGRFAFFAPMDWELTLTLPAEVTVAAGGRVEEQATKGEKQVRIRADRARELPLVLFFGAVHRVQAGSVTAYARREQDARALAAAAQEACGYLAALTGGESLEVCLVESGQAGISQVSGDMLLLPQGAQGKETDIDTAYRVASGVAQGLLSQRVGVDPYREPWLCESLAGFLGLLSLLDSRGIQAVEQVWQRQIDPALSLTVPGGVRADMPMAYFASQAEAQILLQGRGVAALFLLWDVMGEEAFLQAVSAYVAENAYEEGTIEAFVTACNQASGGQWGAFLTDMLHNIEG